MARIAFIYYKMSTVLDVRRLGGNVRSQFETGCEFVRQKIISGEWQPGHKLPSQAGWEAGTPGLALKYGTLRGVYITLRTEGWIEGQQGTGVFVTKNPPIPKEAEVKKATGARSKQRK